MMLGWIAAALCVALAVAVVVLHRRELERMARFLTDRDPASNERLTTTLPGGGFTRIAQAINALMDASAQEKRAMLSQQKAFQRDLASLSHDIRTPLAGAKGYVQLAQSEEDVTRQRADLRMASERLDAMQHLLDQLFSYTRTTDPDRTLRTDSVEVVSLLEGVLASAVPQFEARGWQPHVSLEDSLCVPADSDALTRVFQNIVQNQLAHAAGAPSIIQEGHRLVFENPVGDAAALDVTRIFERFYRLDTARGTAGAGLGLAVVRELCDAMGIQVTAQADQGAFRMIMRFPDATLDAGRGVSR